MDIKEDTKGGKHLILASDKQELSVFDNKLTVNKETIEGEWKLKSDSSNFNSECQFHYMSSRFLNNWLFQEYFYDEKSKLCPEFKRGIFKNKTFQIKQINRVHKSIFEIKFSTTAWATTFKYPSVNGSSSAAI